MGIRKPERGGGAGPGPEELLAQLGSMVEELHPRMRGRLDIGLDTRLDRDLGLDSLSRMELLARLEGRYHLSLPERLVAEADTPRDLLRAFRNATDAPAGTEPAAPAASGKPPGLAPPSGTGTLVDALQWHAAQHPDRVHVHLLDDSSAVSDLSYAGLLAGARRVAAGLHARGFEPGDAVAIMLPTGFGYLYSFFGVQLAGGVPVPVYPPARPSQIEHHLQRHARILDNARVRWLLSFAPTLAVSRLLSARLPRLRGVLDLAPLLESAPAERIWSPAPGDVAFLQYTSGSTGNPKGVILTHADLLASLDAMHQALEIDGDDVFVSWLPLYHDMGLIGAWLGSLYYALPLVLMSPLHFLARPVRWLQAVHRYRATLSGGPNFAYELCSRRIEEPELAGLDLGSWRVAFNGAEPVSPATSQRFAERFAGCGFAPRALTPVYGLAEATLGVAFTPVGRGPRYEHVEREAMQRRRYAKPPDSPEDASLTFVSSGVPLPGFEVRVVDDAGREGAERVEGRVQFRGPSTTSGYYRDPEATRALFDGDWLESGDLGYVAGGELFITGRAKDLIIRAGRNLYPYELEQALAELRGVRRGCVAVFGSRDPATGTERLVVVAETRERDPAVRGALARAIEATAITHLDSPPEEVLLVPPHTVLKTSSGKIRRRAIRELYEQGRLRSPEGLLALQVLRLVFRSVLPGLRRALVRALETGYAGCFWLMVGLVALVVWPGVALARNPRRARAFFGPCVRALLLLLGLRPRIDGATPAGDGSGQVLVFNHASYLDGLVLSAVLDPIPRYVAKRELRAHRFSRLFLEGIGCLFVERFDLRRSAEDARAITEALARGGRVGVFAEGTMHRMPGLLPFQLGAFIAAVESGAPVVPVVLRGTRSVLRSGSWFPRRGAVRVRIGTPIDPASIAPGDSSWKRAVRLRDTARAMVLRHCGEPDLADRQALLDLAPPPGGDGT